jgi:hypothetical protein
LYSYLQNPLPILMLYILQNVGNSIAAGAFWRYLIQIWRVDANRKDEEFRASVLHEFQEMKALIQSLEKQVKSARAVQNLQQPDELQSVVHNHENNEANVTSEVN